MKKQLSLLSILTCFVLLSCEQHQEKNIHSSKNDSIEKYIKLASNNTFSIKKRTQYNDKAYHLIPKNFKTKIDRNILANITFEYYKLNEIEKFNTCSKILHDKALTFNDTINIGKALRCKALYYSLKKIHDSSFYFINKAEKIYLKTNSDYDYALALLNKGIFQYNLGDLLGSELSLNKAYIILKKLKNYEKTYSILNQLGVVTTDLKDFDKAIFYYEQAIEIAKKLKLEKSNTQIENCYNSIGYIHNQKGNYKEAIKIFNLALKKFNLKNYNPELYCYLIDNLAYAKLQSGNQDQLPNLFFEALNLRIDNNYSDAMVTSYSHLSEYYHVNKDNKRAKKYSEIALKKARNSSSKQDLLIALKRAFIVDENNSSKYSEEYIKIKDSLHIEERKSKDRFARIQFETDEITKEKDIAVQHKQNVIIGASILLILGILFFIIYRQRTAKKKLLLEQSNQKINEEIYQLMLSQKNNEEAITQKEKKRIALELHDGVMNKLASTRLNLFVLSKKNDPETIKKCISHIAEIQSIEQEIRNIAHDLNNEIFKTENSFIQMLKDLIQNKESNSLTQYEIEIDKTIPWEKISSEIKMNLYRILQEAIHNIEKHANAKKATISLIKDQNNIGMSVSDNGIGFDTQKKKNGIGIQNMLYRVKNLNGKISINSFPNSNTSINISIPIS